MNSYEIEALRNTQKSLYQLDNPYQGNKRKIIVDIFEEINKTGIHYQSVTDVFSGSGVCSIFFKMMGKSVYCNDLLTSSYYNALAFVANSQQLLTQEHIDYLCSHLNNNKTDFVRKEYSNRFTPEEAIFLDNYRANVDDISKGDETLKALAIVLIEHYVMRNCFLGGRLNRGQILAELKHRVFRKDVKDSEDSSDLYGHKQFDERSKGIMKFHLQPLKVFQSDVPCKAYNLDAIDFLNEPFTTDLVYLDPPYGSAQSNYAEMFRFCEEYIYQDKLENIPRLISAANKFSSKKNYTANFQKLLDGCRKFKNWAISYNDGSWANIDTIKSIILDYKKDVKVISMDYKYKYRREQKAVEYLLIAR